MTQADAAAFAFFDLLVATRREQLAHKSADARVTAVGQEDQHAPDPRSHHITDADAA